MLGFEELVLTDTVKNKLRKWPIDIRAALSVAFTNAISKPEMVGDYSDRRFEIPPTTVKKRQEDVENTKDDHGVAYVSHWICVVHLAVYKLVSEIYSS